MHPNPHAPVHPPYAPLTTEQAACRLGAYVAGAAGATPRLDPIRIAALLPSDPDAECGPDGCVVVPADLILGR